MNVKIYLAVIALVVIVVGAGVSIFGGSKDQMPAVSEQNCQPEAISKIRDSDMRREFSGKCFWRGAPGKSSDKGW
ncbi:entry exclusion lipoprotein TrbK [Alcaligenes nematophilus]|uniref:entry exclusion lipoprotein TrbK n=1 Tax=Pseudomonadota TaxID=1224 RepID=UPI0020CD7079|nr:entry exclusion lipoprotein TrbK [Klebsiella pneumoniae]EDU3493795.1 entry exclusion lipoprotein TrbK [Salmonella enterica subsp. enterica serovar Brazos]EED4361510.1 entry exclusion lipoprotein TrbK [Salmonella enterica subsp. enterica]EEF8198874.1 entry exclusion lipoprotein TrbK [Salmonella enterica]MCS8650356.1 entry exclusion lipoprotein TrbK [Pseudomonas aeruginosa]EEM3546234.1 entry exclusion lipoprotein TrbK [Salmonella enterica]